MKVEISIEVKNNREDIEGSFVTSRVFRILEIDVVRGTNPTKVVSELIIAMEKEMLKVKSG